MNIRVAKDFIWKKARCYLTLIARRSLIANTGLDTDTALLPLKRKSHLCRIRPLSNFPNYFSDNKYTSCEQINVRYLHLSPVGFHGEYEYEDPKSEEDVVTVTVYDKDGKPYEVRGKVGDNLLYLCKRFEVPMEGACEASLACTTCHVYVDEKFQDRLPESTEKEEDLLDIAPFLKENSRLGCQIILNHELQGLKITLPSATRNFYVDGHKPTPH